MTVRGARRVQSTSLRRPNAESFFTLNWRSRADKLLLKRVSTGTHQKIVDARHCGTIPRLLSKRRLTYRGDYSHPPRVYILAVSYGDHLTRTRVPGRHTKPGRTHHLTSSCPKETTGMARTLSNPCIPVELQWEIAHLAIAQDNSGRAEASPTVNTTVAGTLRLVNSDWCHFVSKNMFTRVYLNSDSRYQSVVSENQCFRNHIHPLQLAHTVVIMRSPLLSCIKDWLRYPFGRSNSSDDDINGIAHPKSLHVQQVEVHADRVFQTETAMSKDPSIRFRAPANSGAMVSVAIATFISAVLKPKEVTKVGQCPEKSLGAYLWLYCDVASKLGLKVIHFSPSDMPGLLPFRCNEGNPEEMDDVRRDLTTFRAKVECSCPRAVIRSSNIRELAISALLLDYENIDEINLVGWDSEVQTPPNDTDGSEGDDANQVDGWQALVQEDRSREQNPSWDPKGKIRWLTSKEWEEIEGTVNYE